MAARVGPALRPRASCFVRSRPRAGAAPLGVAKRGDALPRADRPARPGWVPVVYRGRLGWVSEKYIQKTGGGR